MKRGSETVLLGKVSATHGIKGQLCVVPYSGEFASVAGLDSVILKNASGGMDTFAVTAISRHGKKAIITLKDFDNINQVLHLVGRELCVRRDQLPALSDGEYYWFDLLGLRVVTDQGENLGILSDIIATGSNDVYVVKSAEREYLIPALEEVVREIDLDDGIMKVSPLEGLFDL
jgi:16S rRNA processing protein RimM